MVKIAILGYGTVGSGVFEVLRTNKEIIKKRTGDEIDIKYILDIRDFPDSPAGNLIVHDFGQIVRDEEIKIVVEVMGGIEPAYTFVKQSLLAGKSVVTSNKALVAAHGAKLLSIAKEKGINFLYEASVGGGIPVIRALTESLTGDEIEEIAGILNGTTNYMMSRMYHEDADYDAVLREAQSKGYAERDPEADVKGYDACRKIAILLSIVSGKTVDFEDIYTEGITGITPNDIKYAKKAGMKIKLLASFKRDGAKYSAIVAPHMVPEDHPLYNIEGVFNAIFIKGNMLGDAMFYGSGAGKLPTASAVAGDIVEAAKNPCRSMMAVWDKEKLVLEPKEEIRRRFFVRMKTDAAGKEEAGYPASRLSLTDRIKDAFGDVEIITLPEQEDELAFMTRLMSEREYDVLAKKFPRICGMIRIECSK